MDVTRLLSAVLLHAALGLLPHSTADAAESPEGMPPVSEIAKSIREWRSNVAILHVSWKTSNLIGGRIYSPGRSDEELAGNYHVYDFIWTDKASFRIEVSTYLWGKLQKRVVDGSDGKIFFCG